MRRNQISRPSIVGSTMSTLYNSESRFSTFAGEHSELPRFSKCLTHQQGIAHKGDQHVCLHSLFELMEERSNGQLTLERAKLEEDFQEESKSRRFMTCTANDVL